MKRIIVSALVFLSVSSVYAADLDSSRPLLCSTVTVIDCVPGGSCEQVKNKEVGAPDFIRIDVRKKTMTGAADVAFVMFGSCLDL